ncbi:MAG TPA: hypothetical protein VGF82_19100 [Terracidiphilus sp.]|jgi:hypothetical protein
MSLRNLIILCSLLLVCTLLSRPAYSQQDNSSSQSQDSQGQNSQVQDQSTVSGTVVASGRNTFVVRSDDNQFHLFTFDHDTNKPRALPVGSEVRVKSEEGDQPNVRHATDVTVEQQAQGSSAGASSARNAAPIPPPVRNVETQIEHETRRWRLGARAGVGLNPELILFGIHSQMGPIFSRNVFFRPNADFEWGEITDMVALNLEAVYRFPHAARRGQWAPYVGAGPSLNFIHQSFKTQASQQRNISFGNFDYETGFNILMGFQNRHGTFFEAKTSLYSEPAPVFRLILGRNF